jgi:hypothetical protein
MTQNPYISTLTSVGESPTEPVVPDRSLQSIARSVFLAWEKLRPFYLIILALVTVVFLAGANGLQNFRLWQLVIPGALVANVLYFAGPAMETYVRWLGYNRGWPRWLMFVGGTVLSIFLALGLLITELLPNQP